MSAAIVPVGLTPNEVMPGIYIEIDWAKGSGLGAGEARPLLCLANKLPSGSAITDVEVYGPDTSIPLESETQMIALAGSGSEAHRMFRRMSDLTAGGNSGPKVYWLFVTESTGARATGTVTLTAPTGNATGDATHRLFVGDEFVDTPIGLGDTPNAVAAAIAANVNGKAHWAVSASANNGVVTLTSKQAGFRGNQLRFQALVITDHDVGMTTTGSADSALSGGTGSDSLALALSTIASTFYYYIVAAADDAAQLGALASQIRTQSLPMNGLRQRMVYGSVDTPAGIIATAIAINDALSECAHEEKSPWSTAELAANQAMMIAIEEADELQYRSNFIGYGNSDATRPLWKVPASRVTAARPSIPTLRSLLANGVSPIATNPNGSTYLVDRFTNRSLNGAVPETRIRAAQKVTTMHRFADYISRAISEAGEGLTLADDPPNGAAPIEGTFTPSMARIIVFEAIDTFAANAKIQNPDEIKRGTVIQREKNPSSRLGIKCPIQTSDNFRQAAIVLPQVA